MALIAFCFFFASPTFVFAAGVNLIANPSLEVTSVSGIPDNWFQGNWGTNATTFEYPVVGVSGVAAKVSMSSFGDGDAKWYFKNVPVTPGVSYDFSDFYSSTVGSKLVVAYTSQTNTVSYAEIGGALPATDGVWKQVSVSFVPPLNTTSLTVYHLIEGVGSLSTDDYSLTLSQTAPPPGGGGTTPPTTPFPTGLVSLTFDDGWQSHYDSAFPILQSAQMKGTYYIISDAMKNADFILYPSKDNPIRVVKTTKSVKWSPLYTDPSLHTFTFSDTYTANSASTIKVSYTLANGTASSTTFGPFVSGSSKSAKVTFTLPPLGGPLTIVHSVSGTTATLTATNAKLTQKMPYMDATAVRALQTAGNEIGNHTKTHCDLVALQSNPNNVSSCAFTTATPATALSQVKNARNALTTAGFTVDTIAYPYGSGAGNATIETMVKTNGHIAARGVGTGYNTKTTDTFALLTQNIDASTKASDVQGWIDYAVANKVWLILTLHQVEPSYAVIEENQEVYATTSDTLQSIVSYLATQQDAGAVKVDTVHNIMTQYMK